ncbi:MAG: hypothetical protein CVU38_13240 [Chloroflexi bacterium HGW-Chloroflexi-1]|nr:MAG: hypothetical protein CVU38_13240 [Chloroflexi bacterium HGW-Chloroflexi-1]
MTSATTAPRPHPIDWLLEPDNPSVRYLTLRRLLSLPEDATEIQAARSAILRSPVVKHIFARQASGGYWGDPDAPYLPKYKATYWTVMLLGQLGLSRESEVGGAVQRGVEHVFSFQQPAGGFPEYAEEGARREYALVAERRPAQGKASPEESVSVADLVHQMTLSCLTGNVVAALLRLGYGDDPRLWRAVDWLVAIQNADGGWLCPYWKAHVRDKHGCFYGAIAALEAFAEIPADRRPPAVQAATTRGAEFLLMHHLYRADHHDLQVINPGWLELAFPWFYRYHILRGLWVLAKLGYRDARMADALGVLREKQTPEGKWVLESTPHGRMQANLEKRGQPSKWLTLYALWTLEALEG